MPDPSAMADRLIVNCNPTAKALPFHAGLAQGIFERRGIALELVSTNSSRAQRDGIANGDFQIVHVAIDNAISMRDDDGVDVVAIMGGDPGMNELIVTPDIEKIEDIRGGRLFVDAPDTAFALQAYRMFADKGLMRDRDYEVIAVGRGELRVQALKDHPRHSTAVLNLPYSLETKALGLRSLGDTIDYIGPYQAGSAFGLRSWFRDNHDLTVRYIAAYVDCLSYVLDPANQPDCAEICIRKLKIDPSMADETVRLLRVPKYGLDPRAAMDRVAVENTLALRRFFDPSSRCGQPEDYYDMSWHEAAMKLLRGVSA
jgi:ABC-type nitrate/sulfonate/bicarbonate transport system substrate-binding protein